MRLILLSTIASMIALTANAATIGQELITPASGSNGNSNQLEYGFQLSGFNLNQEAVDIQFDSAAYLTVLDAMAPAGYTALVLPGNSAGEPFDLILEGPAAPIGTFDVSFTLSGTGQTGPLNYLVYSVDSGGNFSSSPIDSGTTTIEIAGAATPEPVTVRLILVAAAALCGLRRRA
jgi:hypothetical protein